MRQSAAAVRAHDDQVHPSLPGVVDDAVRAVPGHDFGLGAHAGSIGRRDAVLQATPGVFEQPRLHLRRFRDEPFGTHRARSKRCVEDVQDVQRGAERRREHPGVIERRLGRFAEICRHEDAGEHGCLLCRCCHDMKHRLYHQLWRECAAR